MNKKTNKEKIMLKHALDGKFGKEVNLIDLVSKKAVKEFINELKEKNNE